jgi:hypothetical protein
MGDEKDTKLAQDDLKQVAGATTGAKELSLEELNKASGGATADYFLKIDGVDGESMDDRHKDKG